MSDLGEGLRELAAAVREGMAEREEELRIALGVDAGTLDPETAQSVRAPFAMDDDRWRIPPALGAPRAGRSRSRHRSRPTDSLRQPR